jgi:antitoxin (DNA-binding transcriptional repressor) of toxin-antitoxin stability system
MKTVELDEATGALSKYAQDAAKEPVVVLDHGIPIAAVISIEDTDLETLSLGNNAQFFAILGRSRARHRAEGGISAEERCVGASRPWGSFLPALPGLDAAHVASRGVAWRGVAWRGVAAA